MRKVFLGILFFSMFSSFGLNAKEYNYNKENVTEKQMSVFKSILLIDSSIELNIKFYNSFSDDWSVNRYFIHTEKYSYQKDKKFGCFDIKFNRHSPNMPKMDYAWLCTEVNYNDEKVIYPITKKTFWQKLRTVKQ
ncbi:hypothetical protein AAIR98_000228 [Elusimicrobium simillimum]|uniref:hypothetical protein n=1 Tax=Elusimicrobium simillimum TaxID=3143438 RepID=UPI003C6FC9E3